MSADQLPQRPRVIDVHETWPDIRMLDPRTGKVRRVWRAKPLRATLAERVIERQCERASRENVDNH
jgi:hypothetical protein